MRPGEINILIGDVIWEATLFYYTMCYYDIYLPDHRLVYRDISYISGSSCYPTGNIIDKFLHLKKFWFRNVYEAVL